MKSLEQLLAGWEAGTLTQEELAELKQHLATPEARAELLAEWQLSQAICHTLRSQPAEAPELKAAPAETPGRQFAAQPVRARRRLFPRLVWREVRIPLRWSFGVAAAACLVLVGLNLYFEKAAVGQLVHVQSQVTIERGGRKLAGRSGDWLYPADVLRVSPAGAVTVAWPNEPTQVELAGGTELQLLNPLRGKRLMLRSGLLQAVVAPQSLWRPLKVRTPQAEAEVVGTQFSLAVTNLATRLEVLDGAVRFWKTRLGATDTTKEVLVRAGEMAAAAAGVKLQVQLLTGFLATAAWEVPAGTPFAEAPVKGVLLRANQAAGPAPKASRIERQSGYLIAPATGEFTFWIASLSSNTRAELWLSTDTDPAHKQRIAFITPGAAVQPPSNAPRRMDARNALNAAWQRSPTQKSAPQKLVRGRRYYLELWHEGADLAPLALGWRLPGEPESVGPSEIDVQALCPFVEPAGPGARSGRTGRP